MTKFSFTIDNTAQTFTLKRGYSLLNNLLLNDIVTASKCGGKAICGRCRVKITFGIEHCNQPRDEEKVILGNENINKGWRLACQTFCIKDVRFKIPDQADPDSTDGC